MSPDLSSSKRSGLVALAAALLAAGAMAWWAWSDQPAVDEQLETAQVAAKKISGNEPLRKRVELQRAANQEMNANLAELKRQAGFSTSERFKPSAGEKEKGKFFADRFVDVRQKLRDQAKSRNIDSNERLGFPPDDRIVSDAEAPLLLDMLQLTEKALAVLLAAPDPVESFDISHGKPYETGPASRPALLTEYPLTLKVRGSLKTILWILHRYGSSAEGDYPLILRGLSIDSSNKGVRDEVQQLDAVFELAGMAFIPDSVRGTAGTPVKLGGGGGSAEAGAAMKARP